MAAEELLVDEEAGAAETQQHEQVAQLVALRGLLDDVQLDRSLTAALPPAGDRLLRYRDQLAPGVLERRSEPVAGVLECGSDLHPRVVEDGSDPSLRLVEGRRHPVLGLAQGRFQRPE